MGEPAIVRGTVIGDAGAPVAGWVSLGKKQPQRWISHVVRIKSDDGREITIEDLGGDTIAPVTREPAKWRDIEGDELAKLCSREAPAPDVEVDFTKALLRGGDSIVAWGVATDHGYAGTESLRGTSERAITKLAARIVAIGGDREAVLERTRDRLLAKEREAAAKAARVKPETAPEPKPAGPKRDPDYVNRIGTNYPLWLTGAGFAIVGAFASANSAYACWLRIAAVVALLPIALDAVAVPRFRQGLMAPATLEIPFIGFLLGATGVVLINYGLALGEVGDPSRANKLRIASFVLAGIAALAFVWLWSATRNRRRWLGMIVDAPPLDPPRDGVWGAVDGAFSSEVMSIGENLEVYGMATKDAAGIKSRSVRGTPFANLSIEGTLRSKDTTHQVRLAEAAILAMAKLDKSTGTDKGVRADVINARTPVRVVGRKHDGMFVKGGEASLLVFAGGVDTDLVTELKRLRFRDRLANALAIAGVIAFATSFFV